jgi:tRNA nucleotidyltransferase (CCA-adding enzyme)
VARFLFAALKAEMIRYMAEVTCYNKKKQRKGGSGQLEVITTHIATDFDGLGAMLAASKLHPEAALYFPGHISRPVREFYSLYKDILPIRAPERLNLSRISELIIVDTQQRHRLGRFEGILDDPHLRVTIYDHHPTPENPIQGAWLYHEPVGAATTILVHLIKARELELSEIEATVMALGIYADTGCLTTESTTPDDAAAVSFLLSRGANLEIIRRHLNGPLSGRQRELLEGLLLNTEEHLIQGVQVLLASCSMDEYIDGLGQLVAQLADLEDADVIICLVEMNDRVHLVGRSRNREQPINRVFEQFGGGGHPQAASATVRGANLSDLKQRLLDGLQRTLQPPHVASSLMSSPVHFATPEMTMAEVSKSLLRYGHSGLPVVKDDKVVGVISRRDVDKSIHHGLAQAPVTAFMSSQVFTVGPDASLDEIRRLLVNNDIGRLPVVDAAGNLLGIVTRTDVLKALHGESYPHWYRANYQAELDPRFQEGTALADLLMERLPEQLQGLLVIIGKEAARQDVRAYLVGGLVRDLLLGRPNLDVDIVVEPSAIPFAEHLAGVLGAQLRTHPQFQTATLLLPAGESIDLVTARTEFYRGPAALPDVDLGTIRQDLYRRDFTINTMAICLAGARFGELLDFFGGRDDLRLGLIRVLFNLSFVEDPTRILRAIRFEQRYGFQIEDQTLGFLRSAVKHQLLSEVSAERLRGELREMLAEENAAQMILRMDELEVLSQILPEVQLTDTLIEQLRSAAEQIAWFRELNRDESFDQALIYLLVLAGSLPSEAVATWPERLALNRKERELVLSFGETISRLGDGLQDDADNAQVADLLEGEALECQVAAAVIHGGGVRRQLGHYWRDLAGVRTEATGHDLLQLGMRPGPEVGRILRQIHIARLNGQVTSKQEELELARQLLAVPDERS